MCVCEREKNSKKTSDNQHKLATLGFVCRVYGGGGALKKLAPALTRPAGSQWHNASMEVCNPPELVALAYLYVGVAWSILLARLRYAHSRELL
jgi:hypothetical protein